MEKRYYEALAWFYAARRVYPLTVWSVLTEIIAEAEKYEAQEAAPVPPANPTPWYGIVDPITMKVVHTSPPVLEYLGITRAELFSKPITEFLLDGNAPLMREMIEESARTGMETHAFMSDRYGRGMTFTARPVLCNGQVEVEVVGQYASYRLRQAQLVGEA